jgi:hypothetical protein
VRGGSTGTGVLREIIRAVLRRTVAATVVAVAVVVVVVVVVVVGVVVVEVVVVVVVVAAAAAAVVPLVLLFIQGRTWYFSIDFVYFKFVGLSCQDSHRRHICNFGLIKNISCRICRHLCGQFL